MASSPPTDDVPPDANTRPESEPSIDETATVALSSGEALIEEPGVAVKIGRHVVLEEIGRGGMGSVFRAYDPKLQREVALKRLRAKALGTDGRARFEQEARAMASLSHPNVVGVYDVEALDDGQLVLVMEFVDGPTLRGWLRQTSRPWQDVLWPFLQAGRGLAAAHRAGLLHRDFKPANVLVTTEHAKVTDFGLAKRAKDHSLSSHASSTNLEDDVDEDDLTRAGEVMGTPRYMAPEQHRGESLSNAVDQFAFCVALWEALTEAPPYSGKNLAKKKAKGPPEWPTACGPRWLGDALRRGLSPKPEQRWPTMDALLAALARDPNAKRSQLVRGGGVLALLGVVGTVAYAARSDTPSPCTGSELQLHTEWGPQAREAVHAGMTAVDVVYADSLAQRVDERLDTYAQAWVTERKAACEATVRKEHSEALRDLRVGCLDRGRVAFSAIVNVLVHADVDVLRSVDTMVDELPDLTRCSDLAALQEGTNPPSATEADAVASLREQLAAAKVDRLAGHFDAASDALQRMGRQLDQVDYAPVRGEYQLEHAKLLLAQGRQTDAADAFRGAMRQAVETRDWQRTADAAAELIATVGDRLDRPDDVLVLREVAEAAAKGDPLLEARVGLSVGVVLSAAGQYEAGERRVREAIALLTETVGTGDPRTAGARNSLGGVLRTRGKLADAEAEYRTAIALLTEALGPDHPKVAIVRGNLANTLRLRGELADAEAEARAADKARLRSLGPNHVLYGSGKSTLADILTDARRFEEAEAEAKQALEIVRAAVGGVHRKTGNAINSLGRILIMQGKAEAAERAFREVLQIRTELNGPDNPATAGTMLNVAVALRRQNRLEEAEQVYKEAQRIWTQAFGSDHPDLAGVHNNLGVLYLDMERYEDAKRETLQALRITRTFVQPDNPKYLDTRSNLSEAYAGLGEFDAAIAERREVLEAYEPNASADDPRLALFRSRLAQVLIDNGEVEEGLALAERAQREVRKEGLAPAEQGRLLLTTCYATAAADPSAQGRAKARALAQQALQMFVQAGLDGELDAQETRDWLADHPG